MSEVTEQTQTETTGKTVTIPDGVVLLVMNRGQEQVPNAFALIGTRAKDKKCIRIAGGCKGLDEEGKTNMLEFFRHGFAGYAGIAFSGGTRTLTDDGKMDPMVTDIPGIIAENNEGVIALGTAPRTGQFTLQGESVFTLDQYGTIANPSMAAILLVQNGAEGLLDWDGDVDVYFEAMKNWEQHADFQNAIISYNGGGVTETEVRKGIKVGWPTILVKGSGRFTDQLIEEYENGETPKNVHVVEIGNAEALNQILQELDFIG